MREEPGNPTTRQLRPPSAGLMSWPSQPPPPSLVRVVIALPRKKTPEGKSEVFSCISLFTWGGWLNSPVQICTAPRAGVGPRGTYRRRRCVPLSVASTAGSRDRGCQDHDTEMRHALRSGCSGTPWPHRVTTLPVTAQSRASDASARTRDWPRREHRVQAAHLL